MIPTIGQKFRAIELPTQQFPNGVPATHDSPFTCTGDLDHEIIHAEDIAGATRIFNVNLWRFVEVPCSK